MADDDPPRPASQLVPLLIFALLVAALLAGVWLFPKIFAYMSEQDCIASGHVNCGRPAAGQ